MDNTQRWFLILQAATAIGTILVAVVAIWGDYIRFWLASPELRLSLRGSEGEFVTRSDNSQARYYHLVVRNSRAWARAKNVNVFVIAVQRPGPHGAWQTRGVDNPVPLLWQFSNQFPADLPIGPERICDLGVVVKDEGFKLASQFSPYGFDGTLHTAGKLRVRAVARGDNAESSYVTFEVAWDGEWSDGDKEMARHLVVTQIGERGG